MIPPKPSAMSARLILLVAFLMVPSIRGFAQSAAARPDRGVMPNGSYSVSDIENISLQNGNVNLEIPLASLPPVAGGELSWTVKASYNSKVWNTLRVQQDAGGQTWQPYVVSQPSADGGWVIGGIYTIIIRNAMEDFQRLFYPSYSGLSASELNLLNNNDWWKVLLRMPDGSEHEFRPTDHLPYSGSQEFLKGFYNVIPNGTPMRYYSVDGTYMSARITSFNDWTVYLRDGTQIVQTPDNVQRIKDPNGNKIKIYTDGNGTHYQDEQTGRELRLAYNGAGVLQLWYNTVGGTPQHVDIIFGTTTVQGKVYTTNGSGHCTPADVLWAQLQVVREIVFPQTEPGQPQRKFTFSYNSDTTITATDTVIFQCPNGPQSYTRTVSRGLGQLSQIVTPSGSVLDYSYSQDGIHDFSFNGFSSHLSDETITEKKLTHDGTVETWSYAVDSLSAGVLNPDGSFIDQYKYCVNDVGCVNNRSGLVYRTIQPFRKVERHWTNLVFSGANVSTPDGVIVLNPVVDKEYTTLTDAQGNNLKMSATVFAFDYNGNVVQETHYDWFDPTLVTRDAEGVPTGVPASATVLRVVNHSHYNQASTAASANVYAKRSISTSEPLILDAPKETTLGPSIVQLSYDGQAYGVAPTIGNLTTQKVWVDVDSKWITTSNTYGLYGNIASSTDGRGKVTQYFYDDGTHALPTRVVVDPQNGTGTQTTTTAYDYYTGLVTSQTDANNQVSTINYTNQLLGTIDPFGRPGITMTPQVNIAGSNHQRRVTTTYLDSTRQVIVATDLNSENDKLLKTRTTADQLGRTILTEQTEDGVNYTISSRNAYLDMGRVTLTSTAMRSTAASTDSWTRITKDSAHRVIEVASFGGATQPAWSGTSGTHTGSITTAYEANFTTITDQTNRVKRSGVDALGRLVRVDEPDTSGNLGSTGSPAQPTSYVYDVLGNLTTVTQGAQVRLFTYDSLSRLRTAKNPESGTPTNPYTAVYQYDDNGNLVVKTDARGVSAHFEYDSLNRVTRRWYNGSDSTSHTIHNDPLHPIPSGVGITNEAKFYYDTQPIPGAPTFSRGAAMGRLVAQTYGAGTNGDYYGYDVLGRQTLKIQQIGAVNYQMSAVYTLSGALNTLTYPSGRTIANVFDQAGRLTSFNGDLGDGINRTYSSGILYSPSGALVKEQFGTTPPIYNKLFYNSRGQLAEIRASTSYTGPSDTTSDRGAIINTYSSQCLGMCSGASMPDNNGNLLKQQIHIPSQTMRWQEYNYDSLNRLKWAREVLDGGAEQWKQEFVYDRWGNRTINTGITYGTGINNIGFTVDTSNNRLGVPGGQSGVMQYDAAGNLSNDTYSGAGNRTYDGENKITSAWGGNNQAQLYAYDASGQRVKRTVDGVETWQVYGFGGELLADYPANGPAANPQKEYGYRNGELLVTADAGTNLAAGKPATQSSTGWGGLPQRGADGNTDGNYANGSVTHTALEAQPWWQVDLQSIATIQNIKVWNRTDCCSERLSNFYVFVSDNPFTANDVAATQSQAGVSTYYVAGQGGVPSNVGVNRSGRYVRVQLGNSDHLSVAEVQVFGASGGARLQWLVSDHLGTPRMIFEQTGDLATMKRHDYLPFGEELFVPAGGRSVAMGYAAGDGVRQQFTSKERDVETGLDYFLARYYSSVQGRFTSPDEFKGGPDEVFVLGSGDPEKQALVYADVSNPQSLNKYQYVFNNPLRYVDPDGRSPQERLEIEMRRAEREFAEGKITKEEFLARVKAWGIGGVTGAALVLTGVAGPRVALAILAWATKNPEKVNQLTQEAVQASSGNPTSPAGKLTTAEIGLLREGKVAALVGGKVSRQLVIVKGLGRTDIDVIGKAGEYIAVGGPAKSASDVGRQLQILKAAAEQAGVKCLAYFARGTPEEVLKVARRRLGEGNVHIFEDVK